MVILYNIQTHVYVVYVCVIRIRPADLWCSLFKARCQNKTFSALRKNQKLLFALPHIVVLVAARLLYIFFSYIFLLFHFVIFGCSSGLCSF